MNQSDVTASRIARLRDAGEWVQRLADSGDPTLTARWLDWCDTNPENFDAFDQMQRLWVELGRLGGAAPPTQQRALRTSGHRLIALAASIVLLIGGCAWVAAYYFGPRAFDTAIGEQRQVALVDGSVVDLAPGSHLSTRFTPWQREVRLERGQAFFSVAHGSMRPFVVEAGELRVTAVGTAFDVRLGPGDTLVTVREGRVNVVSRSQESTVSDGRDRQPELVRARVGQRVTFSTRAKQLSVAAVDPTVAGSWRSGTLQFLGEPLEEVVSDINRYAQRKIIVATQFRRTRFTGTVSPDNVGDWLEALEQIYAVDVVDRGGDAIHIQARDGHGAGS